MKRKENFFIKCSSTLEQIDQEKDATGKLKILADFYNSAKQNGAETAEEEFKTRAREGMSSLITKWFYGTNIITIVSISAITIKEWIDGQLGKGIITTPVILALIAATVTQNAAAFLLYAKYAFGVKPISKDGQNSE